MLDKILDEKLTTPKGRKSVALYMADYLTDAERHTPDSMLDSRRLMLRRAAKILRALAADIPDEEVE
jgi:hypothetical protein